MNDPWKHRSSHMKCHTCMWYCPKIGPALEPKPIALKDCDSEVECQPDPVSLGRCRRRCPTMSGYPVVFPDDWCGDHKLDELTL